MPSTTIKAATAAISKPTYPPSKLEQLPSVSSDNRHQTRAEVPQQRHEENVCIQFFETEKILIRSSMKILVRELLQNNLEVER